MKTKIKKKLKNIIKKNRAHSLLIVMALSLAGAVTLVKKFSGNTIKSKLEKSSIVKDFVNRTPSPSQKETSARASSSTDNIVNFPELAQTLTEYNALQMKLLKTNDEKQKLKNLYSETSLVEAKNFLMQPENSFSAQISYNHLNAINFLKDAYSYQPTLSSQTALALITDPTVEDQVLPVSSRTLLAKDRAELMYHFSAIEPAFHGRIQEAGLGPVMQKIYANVLKMQKTNLAESQKQIADAKNRD